jgi:hypothetical protein
MSFLSDLYSYFRFSDNNFIKLTDYHTGLPIPLRKRFIAGVVRSRHHGGQTETTKILLFTGEELLVAENLTEIIDLFVR